MNKVKSSKEELVHKLVLMSVELLTLTEQVVNAYDVPLPAPTAPAVQVTVRNPLQGLQERSKALVRDIYEQFGNKEFFRRDPIFQNLMWKHRFTNPSELLNNLDRRGIIKVTKSQNGNRMEFLTIRLLVSGL